MTHRCDFCGREFQKERSLLVHVCEQKQRYQQRDERGVQLGLQAFLRFYETMQGSSRFRTWDDFATSPYYRAFVRFGRYCVNTRTINPARFVDWLLKHNKKIDRWATDSVYTEYLIDYLATESVEDALARSLEWALDWEQQHGHAARDCLRYGSTHAVCYAITTGHVSPWVIYNSTSGQQFLADLDATQISMIWPYIDSDRWQKKLRDYPADKAYAQDMLSQAGW